VLTPQLTLPRVSEPARGLSGLSAILCAISLFLLLMVVIVGLNPLAAHKAVSATGEGNVLRQGIYIVLFGFILVAAKFFTDLGILFRVPLAIMLLVTWCWISLFWAIEPSVASRRLLLTCIIIWTVFIAVEKTGYERTLIAIQAALVLALIANYVAVIISPGTAIHQVADVVDLNLIGNWRGVLPQKNFAGAVCAFTILVFLFASSNLKLVLRLAVVVAASYFLYRSSSKTSMGLVALAVVFGALYLKYAPKFRALIIPIVLIITGSAIAFGQRFWPEIIAHFGRDSLTGRGLIWSVLGLYIQDHWLLGSGYGSFWNIGPDSPVYFYTHSWVAQLGNGHNGYLDLLVEIGAPGLALAVLSLILIPLTKLLISRTIPRQQGAFLVAMLIFCVGHNGTESSIMDRDMIVQVFLMLTLALINLTTRPPPTPGFERYWAWIRPRPRAEPALEEPTHGGQQ
jgi:O-antigen ligase